LAAPQAHSALPLRRTSRKAVDSPGPGMARHAPGERRVRFGNGQGLPAAPRRHDDRRGGRQAPPRNPCRIRGAGTEDAAERPVLSVAQVFELAGQVGRRPAGNIRAIQGGYRLRCGRHCEMRTSPEMYASRAEAERALWKMASDGRADCHHDRRFYALVLLATFASLRWGEATALRRCDLDLNARTVRVRAS